MGVTCVTLEQALSLMVEHITITRKSETVGILDAAGRILDEDVYADMDEPPFDRSPLDGYALIAVDTKGASRDSPAILQVTDEVLAGGVSKADLIRGSAVRIMTGAILPPGADCIVRQEDTDYGDHEVRVYIELRAGQNICQCGEDYRKGKLVAKTGARLNYIGVGVLTSMGRGFVKVRRKPKVALLITGDELVLLGELLPRGKIYDSNRYMLAARMKELGVELAKTVCMGDDAVLLAQTMKEMLEQNDFLITTGGVSVGKKDVLREALDLLGAENIFWKVRIKPGSPSIFSVYQGKPILSLSGNPFAAISTFELLARPVLAAISGDDHLKTTEHVARLEGEFGKASPQRRFIRAFYQDGVVHLPDGLHSSGAILSMMGCNCLIDIEQGSTGLRSGDIVKVVLL